MYEASIVAYDNEIAILNRICVSNIVGATVFFSCIKQYHGFTHNVLFTKTKGIPKEFEDFVKRYLQRLMYEKSLLVDHLNKITDQQKTA